MVSELYPCLIRGFKGLEKNPVCNGVYHKTFDICSCCGFEFGYSEDHDVRLGFMVLTKIDHFIKKRLPKAAFVIHDTIRL